MLDIAQSKEMPTAVELIMQLKESGKSESAIAEFVGVNRTTILRIKHRAIKKIRLDVYLKLLELKETVNDGQ